jgi:hypothetical protein
MNSKFVSKNHFVKQGNIFRIQSKENLNIHDKLPPGNFLVKFYQSMFDSYFYLESVDDFIVPKELYGKLPKQADRILNTFKERPLTTGVFLEGEKGSGKTLLAKVLALRMAQEIGGPCLIVNEPFCGDEFNKFIQDVNQPCMVLFDEFEKVYSKSEPSALAALVRNKEVQDGQGQAERSAGPAQEQILTLLDGVFPSKKLFVITVNDKYKVDNHMQNRPGRLFYSLAFEGLDKNFIIEFCEKNLKPELRQHTSQVVSVAAGVYKFNFDMLKALVEEMNRYNEPANEAVEMLNIKPDEFMQEMYTIQLFLPGGEEVDPKKLDTKRWAGNLNADNLYISVDFTWKPPGKKKEVYNEVCFQGSDFTSFNHENRSAVFHNEDGFSVILTKVQKHTRIVHSYSSYFDGGKYSGEGME